MKKIILVLLTIVILIILLILPSLNKNSPFVAINDKVFFVKVAKTQEEKAKGLSIYNKLPMDKGMIFVFDKKDYYSFWMKDMKFPIDIIYINQNKIVDIFKNVSAPKSQNETLATVRPKKSADMVLEINANLSNKYNFKIGDSVKISL